MSARTIKGSVFTIVVDGKRIVVKHVSGKGKRCRVTAPPGVIIEREPAESRFPSGDHLQKEGIEPKQCRF